MTIDLSNKEFINNPYPTYKKLQELKDPVWIKQAKGISNIEEILLFTKYEDAVAIYKESQKISNDMFKVRQMNEENTFFNHMMGSDGEKHHRLRSSVSSYFNSSMMQNLNPAIEKICDELIDAMFEKGSTVDLMSDYAGKLPVKVIATLLGITDADLGQMRKWSNIISRGVDTISSTPKAIEDTKTALLEFMNYIKEYIVYRKSNPKEQMIDHLIDLEKKGMLSEGELYSMISFLFVAGHETTINSIGNGLWLLLTHPEQLNMIKNDYKLLPNAIEEVFRFESPLQRSSFRISVEPVEINGYKIEPGTQISVALGAANRDHSVFKDPDRFDILRDPNPHISFGVGVHTCLGKHLARAEAKIAFERLFQRVPKIDLIDPNPQWGTRSLLRGLESLKVIGQLQGVQCS